MKVPRKSVPVQPRERTLKCWRAIEHLFAHPVSGRRHRIKGTVLVPYGRCGTVPYQRYRYLADDRYGTVPFSVYGYLYGTGISKVPVPGTYLVPYLNVVTLFIVTDPEHIDTNLDLESGLIFHFSGSTDLDPSSFQVTGVYGIYEIC